jgi:hypothetical protein
MKRNLLLAAVVMTAGSLLAADAKDEVAGAAKKVSAAANYSWSSMTTNANPGSGGGGGGGRGRGGRGGGGPMSGMTEKDGFTVMTFGEGDNAMKAVTKGDKGAIETQDGWQSIAELTADNGGGGGGGGANRGMFMARRLQTMKAPAAEVEGMLAKVKSLSKADDAYSGELTEEGAKALMTFGGRGGGNGPEISDAKGTVKFWVKDGMLSKYETHVTGTMSFNGNEMKRDTTTTVSIKDVGATKVEVPEEAKKKI